MGIMGKKNTIVNYLIEGEKLYQIKKCILENLNIEVDKVFLVSKHKTVFHVITKDNSNLRIDLTTKFPKRKKLFYQRLAYENKINVPKIIDVFQCGDLAYKVSEWIEGKRIGYFWDNLKMFEKCGELIAKVNLLKDPFGSNNLVVVDLSKPNAVWTSNEEVFVVDVIITPSKNVDSHAVKFLKNHVKDESKIKAFLSGYSKFRDPSTIIKRLSE
jgi:hypothetical protein